MLAQGIHTPQFRLAVFSSLILRKKGNIRLNVYILLDGKNEVEFTLAVCVHLVATRERREL